VSGGGPKGVLRTIDTTDGQPLRYRVWPAVGPRRGTVTLLNGVMSHSAWLAPIAGPLAQAGHHVIGADRRGSGHNDAGRGTWLDRKQLLDDLRRVVAAETAGTAEGLRSTLVGWCWGAALAVHAALDPRLGAERLALLTPALFPSTQVREAIGRENARGRGVDADQPLLESPIREEMFTRGPALQDVILRDERRVRRFSSRFFWNMTKIGALAGQRLDRLTLPVLVVLGRRDEAVDNDETRRELAARLPAPPAVTELDAPHGLQFEAPAAVASALLDWIASTRGRVGARS
jgi:alpha-beta hydrolase superfamily lysophospholipase